MPIDPSFALTGREWAVGGLPPAGGTDAAAATPSGPEGGFGGALGKAIGLSLIHI